MVSKYAERRAKTLERLEPSGILILFAAPVSYRNADVAHEYRQDSDFYYLTGFEEAESVLILAPSAEHPFQLLVPAKDPERETWDGERLGVDGAIERLGADAAFPVQEQSTRLLEALKGRKRLYYAMGRHRNNDEAVLDVLRKLREHARRGETCPTEIVEPSTILHEMRLIKSDAEIADIRRAIAITNEGYKSVLRAVKPNVAEYELEAILRDSFRRQGSERCAFAPIVASGKNGRVLHHRRNDRTILKDELVLVDTGAEYGYLAADISRTFPSSGKFSPQQRQAYEIVLRAADRAIRTVAPGVTLEDVHRAALEELVSGLIELGILTGSPEQVLESKTYQKYYMHRTSHWLGMDVHDVGAYYVDGRPRPLVPGMVLTIEPGLYFSAEDEAVPVGLKDVGIRIEDDVLVSPTGVEVLSQDIARSVDDIERIIAVAHGSRGLGDA